MNKPAATPMKSLLIPLALSLLLAACSNIPVSTDYDTAYDFSAVRSFAWLPQATSHSSGDSLHINELTDRRVRSVIEEVLRSKGYRQSDSVAEADILLSYHLGIEERIDINTFHSSFGYYPCIYPCFGYRSAHPFHPLHPFHSFHYPHYNDVWVDRYQSGTLIIDMVDPASRQLSWRGVAERRLPRLETPEDRRLHVQETVQAILERFPPGR